MDAVGKFDVQAVHVQPYRQRSVISSGWEGKKKISGRLERGWAGGSRYLEDQEWGEIEWQVFLARNNLTFEPGQSPDALS
jgi:hypothetical protein